MSTKPLESTNMLTLLLVLLNKLYIHYISVKSALFKINELKDKSKRHSRKLQKFEQEEEWHE